MRFGFRIGCLSLCLALMSQAPASARVHGGRRVLGVVAQTDRGHLDSALAQMGANVYSCDKLDTEDGGVLRVKVGSSQLFLAGSSLAALEDEGSAVQALAMGGTVGFASMRTPAGVIRATNGQPASGEVTYKGPHELLISAMRGALTLETGSEFRTIPEGKSADVTFEGNVDNGCREAAAADQQTVKPYVQHKIGFYIVMGAAAAVPPYLLWREFAESDSKPN